jgi:hypothetical protein
MKVPSAVPVLLVCLVVGLVFGAVLVTLLNVYNPYLFEEPIPEGSKEAGGKGKGKDLGDAKGKGKDNGGSKGKSDGFAKMPPQASPTKVQLIQLIAKLDQLASEPPNLALSDKQKADLLDKLKDVDELARLSDVQASERLAAMVQLLSTDQRDTLQKAGYIIPGTQQGFGGATKGGGDAAAHRKHVQSLREKLAQGKAR